MKTALPNVLDGIARHQRQRANALRAGKASDVIRTPLRSAISAADAFSRAPAYRAQLGELLSIAAEARDRVAL